MEATSSKRRADNNHARAASVKLELPGDTTKRVKYSVDVTGYQERATSCAPPKRNNNTEVIEEVLDFYLLVHTDRPGRRFQHQHCESEFVSRHHHVESMDDIFVTTRRCIDFLL